MQEIIKHAKEENVCILLYLSHHGSNLDEKFHKINKRENISFLFYAGSKLRQKLATNIVLLQISYLSINYKLQFLLFPLQITTHFNSNMEK